MMTRDHGLRTRTNLRSLADAELLTLIRTGNELAFNELHHRYVAMARRLARVAAGRADDAEDILNVALASVYRAIRNGGGPTHGSIGGYIAQAVRSASCERRRLDRLRREVLYPTLADTALEAVQPEADESTSEALSAALNSLPPRWVDLLVSFEVDDEPLHQIAARFGISQNAAAALGRRARAGLRKALANGEHFADRSRSENTHTPSVAYELAS